LWFNERKIADGDIDLPYCPDSGLIKRIKQASIGGLHFVPHLGRLIIYFRQGRKNEKPLALKAKNGNGVSGFINYWYLSLENKLFVCQV
jgi:hypothetical protein